ncbi:MAG: ImmA/IrrE family metallo-endopeptidase [Actinomycetota bacterium]|nr:ImmA/IrrE family metallo-endopeptidase [Actinomycetota bacterium]
MHHPWRVFAGLSDWRLQWAHLPPDVFGLTCHRTKTVTLAEGLTQAERRCTIAHETQHILRGPVPTGGELYEELVINRKVARLLLPSVRRVGHALAFHRADMEGAADDLWVDEPTLHVRLSALAPKERAWMQEQLATIWL